MAIGSTGIVVVAALAAGVAGAGAAVVLMGSPGAPPSPTAAEDGRVAALEKQVARQEDEIRALRARVEESAASRSSNMGRPRASGTPSGFRPGAAPGEGMPDASSSGIESADGASAESAAGTPGSAGAPPLDPARFGTLYKAAREKEQEEGRKARLAAMESQIRARLDRAQDSGLSPDQKGAIVRILLERGEKLRGIYDEARASGTTDAFAAAREKTDAARKESRQALEGFLTPEQLKVVDSVDREDGRGRRLAGRPPEGGENRRREGTRVPGGGGPNAPR